MNVSVIAYGKNMIDGDSLSQRKLATNTCAIEKDVRKTAMEFVTSSVSES